MIIPDSSPPSLASVNSKFYVIIYAEITAMGDVCSSNHVQPIVPTYCTNINFLCKSYTYVQLLNAIETC